MARSLTYQAYRVHLGVLLVLPLALGSCGSSEQTEATSTSTIPATTIAAATTATPTTLVPQTTSAVADIIEVSFDGKVCTTVGPGVVPTGVQSFVLEDLSGLGLADVRTMAIVDDHTYQDLLDLQSEPGEYVALPQWAEWPLTTFEPVDRELAENETGKTLILEPGQHGIVISTGQRSWFCGALEVTES